MRSPRTAMENSPHSPQLEKARAQQRRPNAAKNKQINKFIKKKKSTPNIKKKVENFPPAPIGVGSTNGERRSLSREGGTELCSEGREHVRNCGQREQSERR